jgi:hypothetical protein
LDANGDGLSDLVVTGSADSWGAWVFYGPLRGTISTEDAAIAVATQAESPWASFAPDVDGDGQRALIVADADFSSSATGGGGVFRFALPDGIDTGPPPVDADGDGYPEDCDDADATVHPRAADLPDDGVDQDCDGADTSWDCAGARRVFGNLWVAGAGVGADLASFCSEGAVDLDGDIEIADSDLEDLTALSCLCSVSGGVSLHDNEALSSLAGLESVSSAAGLDLSENAVVSLAPIANMEVTGDVHLSEQALTSLAGLWIGKSASGDLTVFDCDALETLEGVVVPAELPGRLLVGDNAALVSLVGLDALRRVEQLELVDNATLSDVTALHGLERVDNSIWIYGNPMLADADIRALVEAIEAIGGSVVLW